MKVFIVGKHASGKHKALQCCEDQGVAVGHEFSTMTDQHPEVYMDKKAELYSQEDVTNIFEMRAYICITGIEESGVMDAYAHHRGISHHTYDNSDVMVLTPTQLEGLNRKLIRDHVVFVWLDNTQDNRIRRHAEERRTYSFIEQDEIEEMHGFDFVKCLYNFPDSDVLYFTNEDPERVGTIITAIIKHPDLLPNFVNTFN